MKNAVAALIVIAIVAPVFAKDVAPPVTYGAGHKLCSDWSTAEVKPDPSEYLANRFWVAGFMSAYNVYVSKRGFDIGKGLTPDDMKAFMHARCAANPTEMIATAATAWITHLKARQK